MTTAITMPANSACIRELQPAAFQVIDLPYVFIAGGFIGTLYEFVLTLITKGLLEDRTGSILTPFNYVYGVGALVMFLVLYRMKNPVIIFAVGSILGGVVEFGLSVVQELLFGTISWDYSGKWLNIGGRTTIPYMIVWGGLSLIAVKCVFLMLLKLIHKIPEQTRKKGAVIIVLLMLMDMAVTFTAILRYMQRANGIITQNPVLCFADMMFDNKFMATHFPNMKLC